MKNNNKKKYIKDTHWTEWFSSDNLKIVFKNCLLDIKEDIEEIALKTKDIVDISIVLLKRKIIKIVKDR